MNLIFMIVMICFLVVNFHKFIRKYATSIYCLTIFITTLFIINKLNLINYKLNLNIFSKGTIALALFIIVMFTTLITNLKIKSIFMSVRGELSIIACILTLGHNIIYGLKYFKILIISPNNLSFLKLLATIISIIMIVIMIPLMITSFKYIRKKIKYKKWKTIQSMSYIFYILMYIHIMLLYYPILRRKYIDVIIYSIIFNLYFVMRINKYFKDKKKKEISMKKNV